MSPFNYNQVLQMALLSVLPFNIAHTESVGVAMQDADPAL